MTHVTSFSDARLLTGLFLLIILVQWITPSEVAAQPVPIEPTTLPTCPTHPRRIPKVIRQWERAWNTGDAEGMAKLFTPDGIYEDFAFQVKSQTRAGVAQWVNLTAASIPDAHVRVVDAFRAGRRIAVKWVFSGTPNSLGGQPSTGRSFAVAAVSYVELRGKRIHRIGDYYNLADVLRQLELPGDTWTPPNSAEKAASDQRDTATRSRSVVPEPTAKAHVTGQNSVSGVDRFPGEEIRKALLQAAPNPFGRQTALSFSVPKSGTASLVVYDSAGKTVATLFHEYAEAGQRYVVDWGGSRLPDGLYVAKLASHHHTQQFKLVIAH